MEEDGSIQDDYRIAFLKRPSAGNDGSDRDGRCTMPWLHHVGSDRSCQPFHGRNEKKRYGFIYVDMDDKGNGTLERKPKKELLLDEGCHCEQWRKALGRVTGIGQKRRNQMAFDAKSAAAEIVRLVGGKKENINSVAHCMTRLRFVVRI